jgi:hypothetical protein
MPSSSSGAAAPAIRGNAPCRGILSIIENAKEER